MQTLMFLFARIDDCAPMPQRLGDGCPAVASDRYRLIRAALADHGGQELAVAADGVLAAFGSPRACGDAAIQIQQALTSRAWPPGQTVAVQVGIHSGEAARTAAGLAGPAAHRAGRIAAVAPGGEVVASAAVGGLLAGSLPAQTSSFIGRDHELAEVRALVGGWRLVTLTGVGGAGKTRLALQAAAGLAAGAQDRVWFVDLAPLGDPDLVAVTVADVLGVQQEPGRPVLDTLAEAVGGRSLLVLLDNCEHVIGACAKLAGTLLRCCPNLTLLATSREPLGIEGERLFRVPSMRTPAAGDGPEAIRACEAVRLLEDRAAAQGVTLAWDESAAVVAGRICRRLDGIPLAVELAAARLRVMSAAELDSRLDERFVILTGGSRAALPRQQTLRAMVDWSWELLTGAERAVLARLSVFAGGFALAAAEVVATGEDVPGGQVLGHLGALVDKSLVQFGDTGAGPGRYRLVETVRQYAAGQLDAQGPAAARAARVAHRDYYLALAELAAPQLVGPSQDTWLDTLDAELGNLRAAIAFTLTEPVCEPGLRLAASLREFWQARGHAAEGAEALRALLDTQGAQEATLLRARALAAAARLFERTSAYPVAEDCCKEALAIARAAGDEYLVAELLYEQAWILLRQGQDDAAMPLVESGLLLAGRLGETHLTARLLSTRSHTTYLAGDCTGAVRDAAESLRLFRAAGDRLYVAELLGNLGSIELSAGDVDSARCHLAESLAISRGLNDANGVACATFNLGLADYVGGSLAAAEVLFSESLGLARRMGLKTTMAYALLGLAMAGRGGADPGWSARLHGAAAQALADLGNAVEPLEGRLADLDCQRLRAAMGPSAFDAEYSAGRALDLAQVLAVAARTEAAARRTEAAGRRSEVAQRPTDATARRTDAAAGRARVDQSAPPGMHAPSGASLAGIPDARVASESASVLSPRELDVLTLVAQGLSNPDIARRLIVSEHTVHRHLANMLRKLELSSRTAAVAWGVRAGLV